jgi:hypothetical protein
VSCGSLTILGMDKVLPIGKSIPRLFQRIEVNIGKPVYLGSLLENPSSKENSQNIISSVMNEIRSQKLK